DSRVPGAPMRPGLLLRLHLHRRDRPPFPTRRSSDLPLEYIASEIGGEHVHVETIYPPGVDAHTYEPTSKEITSLAKADAFIYLGDRKSTRLNSSHVSISYAVFRLKNKKQSAQRRLQ